MNKIAVLFGAFCLLLSAWSWAQNSPLVSPKLESNASDLSFLKKADPKASKTLVKDFTIEPLKPVMSYRKYQENLEALKSKKISGGIDSGGGVGVRCLMSDGSQRVVTLDYFEQMSMHRPPHNWADHTTAKALVKERLEFYFGSRKDLPHAKIQELSDIYNWANGLQRWNLDKFFAGESHSNHADGIEFQFRSQPLSSTNDIGWVNLGIIHGEYSKYFEKGACQLVQIAEFVPSSESYWKGTLKIDKNLFSQLDGFNKGLLYIHELAYRLNRTSGISLAAWYDEGQLDSHTVRYFVYDLLYSFDPQISLDKHLPTDLTRMQFCQSSDNGVIGYLYSHPEDSRYTTFNFLKLGHRYSIGVVYSHGFRDGFTDKLAVYEDVVSTKKEAHLHAELTYNRDILGRFKVELHRERNSDKFILNVLDTKQQKYIYQSKDLHCRPIE